MLAERRTDGRSGRGLAGGDLQFHLADYFLCHKASYALFSTCKKVQFNGGRTAEDGHHDLQRASIRVHFIDDAGEAGERTLVDLDGLAFLERQFRLRLVGRGRNAINDLLNFFVAQRRGNIRINLESLYAFGALAAEPGGARRRDLLSASGADLAAFVGTPDPAMRYAGVRVIGRVYAHRPSDPPIDPAVGDAVIAALNDRDRAVKVAAMQALGAMRYERAIQALDDLFRYYGKGDLAAAALDAVARIAHPGSAPLFAAELASKSTAIRLIAAEGLIRIGDRAQMTAIETALGTERNEGATLVKDFGAALLSGASIDPIVSALMKPRLRDQAKAYLVDLVGTRLSAFTVFAQDPDAAVRSDIADVLGLAGDPAALSSPSR